MKNWKKFLIKQVMPAVMLLALAAFGPSIARAQSSAGGSKSSDTGVISPKSKVQSPKSGAEKEGEKGRRGEGETRPHRSEPGAPSVAVTGSTPGDLQQIINSCAAAVEDLAKTRILADALERENGLLKERLETEKRTSRVLLELNETRKAEAVSLRETVAAKNETIVAKDGVIAAQDKLIETLKKKKTSPLKRIQDVLIGVGLMALFR